jgi:hypothetical protein
MIAINGGICLVSDRKSFCSDRDSFDEITLPTENESDWRDLIRLERFNPIGDSVESSGNSHNTWNGVASLSSTRCSRQID